MAHFKLAVRQCKRDHSKKQADALTKHLLTKDNVRFFKEVKNIHFHANVFVVDGACGVDRGCLQSMYLWLMGYVVLIEAVCNQCICG